MAGVGGVGRFSLAWFVADRLSALRGKSCKSARQAGHAMFVQLRTGSGLTAPNSDQLPALRWKVLLNGITPGLF